MNAVWKGRIVEVEGYPGPDGMVSIRWTTILCDGYGTGAGIREYRKDVPADELTLPDLDPVED